VKLSDVCASNKNEKQQVISAAMLDQDQKQTINPGDGLDHYRIEGVVSRSAAATIFRAIDVLTNRQVAIKVPPPELEADPTFFDRFRREEEIGEQLDHPGLIKVIPDHDRSRPYIAMEWFDGKPLSQLLLEQTLSSERTERIVVALCRALEYIHSHGIIHRDLRPEHILVDAADHIKLIDFGAAGQAARRRITFTNITQITGGSEYISPEELKGKRGDARSDIYVVGLILYEMVTGRKPFPESDVFDRVQNHPVPPREINPAISPQLQEVIYRALEREPRNRYANAHDFARDLQHLNEVGIPDRAELRDWKKGRSSQPRKLVLYLAMALIPIAIFALLFYFANR
jgi:serine/threonine-protein kinase